LGQAKRRRFFAQATAAIEAEAGGVYALMIVTIETAMEMTVAAIQGDRQAERYVRAIARCLGEIPKQRPRVLCLTCDNQFSAQTMPGGFVFFHANRDDAKVVAANGLCLACAAHPDVQQRVLAVYRAKLFGNEMRILPPFAVGSSTRN
jgi:hypothetical protein